MKANAFGLSDRDGSLSLRVMEDDSTLSSVVALHEGQGRNIDCAMRSGDAYMAEQGIDRIDLLKIDVEGAEYRVLDSILEDKLDITILCVEFDECFHPMDSQFLKRIRASLRILQRRGYSVVCAQGNGNYTLVRHSHSV